MRVLGAFAPIAVWTVRNVLTLGAPIPFTTSTGVNLLIGNNPTATGSSGTAVDISGPMRTASPMSEVQRDAFLRFSALDWVTHHPLDSILLYAAKVANYFSPYNVPVTASEGSTAQRLIAYLSRAVHGPEALALGVRRSVPLLVSALLPIAVVIATLAPQLVDVVYGDKWGPSAAALRYLMALTVVRMLTSLAIDILTSSGFTRVTVWLNATWVLALVPALWIGTHLDGIRGTAVAHAVVGVFIALPVAVLALRHAGVSLVPTLPALVRPAVGAAISASVIILINSLINSSPFIELLVAGCGGMIVYVLVVVPLD